MTDTLAPRPDTPLILASKSPRRRHLLRQIGLQFTVHPTRIAEETIHQQNFTPAELAASLAGMKAEAAAARYERALVIGADTIVTLDNTILGKPADAAEAKAILRRLSGRRHQVITGVVLIQKPALDHYQFTVTTEVQFRDLTDDEIERYISTGEPMDKAGAYGIQGHGALLVREIHGDYFNVVGFPITAFYERLQEIISGN